MWDYITWLVKAAGRANLSVRSSECCRIWLYLACSYFLLNVLRLYWRSFCRSLTVCEAPHNYFVAASLNPSHEPRSQCVTEPQSQCVTCDAAVLFGGDAVTVGRAAGRCSSGGGADGRLSGCRYGTALYHPAPALLQHVSDRTDSHTACVYLTMCRQLFKNLHAFLVFIIRLTVRWGLLR